MNDQERRRTERQLAEEIAPELSWVDSLAWASNERAKRIRYEAMASAAAIVVAGKIIEAREAGYAEGHIEGRAEFAIEIADAAGLDDLYEPGDVLRLLEELSKKTGAT